MTLEAFLHRVLELLEAVGIPYMLTGSIAVAYHGDPRATRDLDVVIVPSPDELDRMLDRLEGEGFYVSRETAHEALRRRGQFNAIDPESGWKVDLIVRRDRPFSGSEFDRRERVELLGRPLPIVTAEDLIVAKREWAAKGGTDLHLRDALAVLRHRGRALDRGYIERWVEELELERGWDSLLAEATGDEAGEKI